MKKNVVIAISALLLALCVWVAISLRSNFPETPELAIKAFYEREVAEDQIMDPLILIGPAVIPLLERDLPNAGMPNRRYAIGALGNLESEAALPILKTLANSKSEIDYIRCDALTAIAMIEREESLRIANQTVQDDPKCLGEIADGLKRDYDAWIKSNAPRRTYLQALFGRHG
ncbi:MAG TPA: hypothetical protein VFU13_14915 [Steroidobacteraceae bacterium]|nr:hypothetical protein [Steroidobacteraceae bacterium]